MTTTLKDLLQEVKTHGLRDQLEGLTYPIGVRGGDRHIGVDEYTFCTGEGLITWGETLPEVEADTLCEECVTHLGDDWSALGQTGADGWDMLDNVGHVLKLELLIQEHVKYTKNPEPTFLHQGLRPPITLQGQVEHALGKSAGGHELGEYWRHRLEGLAELIKSTYQDPSTKAKLRELARIDDETVDDTPILVTWDESPSTLIYDNGDPETAYILLAWDATSAHDEESTWTIVPGDVARWLLHASASGNEQAPLPQKEILETTLGIWSSPREDGDLKSINEAIHAARRLHD